MIYPDMHPAVFLDRPNRFVAHIQIGGETRVCHVKNTGRCRELLTPGARILVQESHALGRTTAYDLISVWKGDRLINMDSAAPNRVFAEWAQGGRFLPDLTFLKPEARRGDSRFDFYWEAGDRRGYLEVKGCTLEEDGVARFPDAPTERGVKHVEGLAQCVREGLEAWAVFVIPMAGVDYVEPNDATHPAFGRALREAAALGVHILALDCFVTEDSLSIRGPIPVRL